MRAVQRLGSRERLMRLGQGVVLHSERQLPEPVPELRLMQDRRGEPPRRPRRRGHGHRGGPRQVGRERRRILRFPQPQRCDTIRRHQMELQRGRDTEGLEDVPVQPAGSWVYTHDNDQDYIEMGTVQRYRRPLPPVYEWVRDHMRRRRRRPLHGRLLVRRVDAGYVSRVMRSVRRAVPRRLGAMPVRGRGPHLRRVVPALLRCVVRREDPGDVPGGMWPLPSRDRRKHRDV
mmetsp:Transcript_10187/g.29105  ORF Transcript_10187/g.29105 Transcript_10187/m.29105 type:complete len:231 (-) Transcript_10187:49-741(-)